MNKRQTKKQRKLNEDLVLVRAWMQYHKWFVTRHVVYDLMIPVGRMRHILHILNRQGEIQQCDRSNRAFGSVYRGDLRTWKVV